MYPDNYFTVVRRKFNGIRNQVSENGLAYQIESILSCLKLYSQMFGIILQPPGNFSIALGFCKKIKN
jgi:hypothetical protein